jgi:hypothetical protein
MKTSMNLLRTTNACVGGFGRQASFWTVRPKAKAIEYPIWLVGLIGNYDDLNWALSNALIVDEAEFEALKDRTFWPMFQTIFWSNISASTILKESQKKTGDFVRDALQEALEIKDRTQAETWMAKYRRFKINNNLFANVANHACWTDPQQYLSHLAEVIFNEKNALCLEHEKHPFDLERHLPSHDSRHSKGVSKVRRTLPTRRDRDDDDGDDTEHKNLYFTLPKSDNGRVVTKGESFAYVILNEDPWPAALQFLLDNNVPKTIGSKVNLSKVSPDGVKPPQFAASLHLNDPRLIFTLMHLLQGQDFDLLRACHILQKQSYLERSVGSYGPGNSGMDELDTIVENEGQEWSEAQEKIIAGQRQAHSEIAESSPTNNAIRERRSPASQNSGDDASGSWDGELSAVAANGSDDEEEDDGL